MRNFLSWTIIIIGCFFLVFWLVIATEGPPNKHFHISSLSLLIISVWIVSLGMVIKKKKRDSMFHIILFISLTILAIVSVVYVNIAKPLEPEEKTLQNIESTAAVSQTIFIVVISLILVFFIGRKILEWQLEQSSQSLSKKIKCPACNHRFTRPRIILASKPVVDRFGENIIQCPNCNHIIPG